MRRVNVQNDAHRVTQLTYSFYCLEHTSYPTYSKFKFYDRMQFQECEKHSPTALFLTLTHHISSRQKTCIGKT